MLENEKERAICEENYFKVPGKFGEGCYQCPLLIDIDRCMCKAVARYSEPDGDWLLYDSSMFSRLAMSKFLMTLPERVAYIWRQKIFPYPWQPQTICEMPEYLLDGTFRTDDFAQGKDEMLELETPIPTFSMAPSFPNSTDFPVVRRTDDTKA